MLICRKGGGELRHLSGALLATRTSLTPKRTCCPTSRVFIRITQETKMGHRTPFSIPPTSRRRPRHSFRRSLWAHRSGRSLCAPERRVDFIRKRRCNCRHHPPASSECQVIQASCPWVTTDTLTASPSHSSSSSNNNNNSGAITDGIAARALGHWRQQKQKQKQRQRQQ